MAYKKKEDWLAEAERLGIDVSDMDWPTLQKTVSQALKREELGMMDSVPAIVHNMAEPEKKDGGIIGRLKKKLFPEESMLKEFSGQELRIAPEIYPNHQRAVHYKEELGDDLVVEEKHYDIRGLEFDAGKSFSTGTFEIKGKTGDRTFATSAIPKEQPGLYFRPDMDYAVVVTFMGRVGYLWTHHRLPNIKDLLVQSGYYEEYKGMFKDEPNIWYSAGLICCDPSVAHHVLKEIEHKEQTKRRSEGQ